MTTTRSLQMSDNDEDCNYVDDDLTTNLLVATEEEGHQHQHQHGPLQSLMERIRKFGDYLGTMTLFVMTFAIPLVTYHKLSNNRRRVDLAAFDSAGVMVIGTVILSLRLVYLHFTHWYMPDVQKYVVRIVWMVPLYAIQSWLSLRFHTARLYIDSVRDLYEAYVIQSFVYYLMELLGGEEALSQTLRHKPPSEGYHTFPLNLVLQPWELGTDFMLQCKHGVLQYVVMKTMATLIIAILEPLGLYGEGEFDSYFKGYPYISFGMNVSVMYALYCLVKLFHAVNYELRHPIDWHPMGKFLCVKGVVFFTWWQSVLIFYLKSQHVINDIGSWNAGDIANGLQDYCICFEMVIFAIVHSFTFTYKEYLPERIHSTSTTQSQQSHQYQHPPEQNVEALEATTLSQQQQQQHESSSTTLGGQSSSEEQNGNTRRGGIFGKRIFKGNTSSSSSGSNNGDTYRPLQQQQEQEPSDRSHEDLVTTGAVKEEEEDSNNNGNGGMSNDGNVPPTQSQQQAPPPPPPTIRTLPRPMGFRDAFWSSTLPKETLSDIKRLRKGILPAKHQATNPGSISLQDISSSSSNNSDDETNKKEKNEGTTSTTTPIETATTTTTIPNETTTTTTTTNETNAFLVPTQSINTNNGITPKEKEEENDSKPSSR